MPIPPATSETHHFDGAYRKPRLVGARSTLQGMPTEILQNIILQCSDMRTVWKLAGVCGRLRNLYLDMHPRLKFRLLQTIFGDVFSSVAVTSAALRCVYAQKRLLFSSLYYPVPVLAEFTEATAAQSVHDLTVSEDDTHALFEFGVVCRGLERLYIRTRKDPRGHLSLTLEEREAFRVALFRIWLLSILARMPGSYGRDVESLWSRQLQLTARDRRFEVIYNHLSTQDLYRVDCLRLWFAQQSTLFDESLQGSNIILSIGPTAYLWRCSVPFPVKSDLRKLFKLNWYADFRQLWSLEQRHVPELAHTDFDEAESLLPMGYYNVPAVCMDVKPGTSSVEPMLGTVEHPPCTKCHQVGRTIWGSHDWDDLGNQLERRGIEQLMPYGLSKNKYEQLLLSAYLSSGTAPQGEAALASIELQKQRVDKMASAAATPALAAFDEASGRVVVPTRLPMGRLIKELLALVPDAVSHLQDDYVVHCLKHDRFNDVAHDDAMLCIPCLQNLTTARLWIWWSLCRKQNRVPEHPLPNLKCLKGLFCHQQADANHAQHYDHFSASQAVPFRDYKSRIYAAKTAVKALLVAQVARRAELNEQNLSQALLLCANYQLSRACAILKQHGRRAVSNAFVTKADTFVAALRNNISSIVPFDVAVSLATALACPPPYLMIPGRRDSSGN